MKSHPILLFATAIAVLLMQGAASVYGQPSEPVYPKILDDPEWQKRFLGSYGFLPNVEPKVNEQELAYLSELIELMKADPSAAAAQLATSVNDQTSPALLFILANLYFQEGQTTEAQKYYQEAVKNYPSFRRAHKNLGLLLMQAEEYDEALGHLSKAAELGEHDGRTHGLMAYAYLNTGDYLAAEESYRDAIQLEPKVSDWKLGLGRVLLETQRNGEAVALFEALIVKDPQNADLWLLQSNAYLGADAPESAAVNLEIVREMDKADLDSLRLLGDIYINMGIPDTALEVYQEALAQSPAERGFPMSLRAARLLYQTNSPNRASELLDEMVEKFSDSISKEQQLEMLTLKASVARALGNSDEARVTLESIVEQDGTQGEALIELASLTSEQGENEKAYFLLERAANLEGFEFKALTKHAQLLVRERKYREAIPLLERALQIKDDSRTRDFLNRVRRAANA